MPTYALLRRASTYVKTSVDRSVGKLVAGCRLLGAGYWLLPARRPTTSIKHDFVGLKSLFFTCPTKYRCCLSVRSWSVGEPARRSLLYSVGEGAGCPPTLSFVELPPTSRLRLIDRWVNCLFADQLHPKNMISLV